MKPQSFVYFNPTRPAIILKEKACNPYLAVAASPVVCPGCNAVLRNGSWSYHGDPLQGRRELCPGCLRIRENRPAGYLVLQGPFHANYNDQLVSLLQGHATIERTPEKRIMAMEPQDGSILVSTTHRHLARDLGEAVQRKYQGRLEFCYDTREKLLRVHWRF